MTNTTVMCLEGTEFNYDVIDKGRLVDEGNIHEYYGSTKALCVSMNLTSKATWSPYVNGKPLSDVSGSLLSG